MNSKMTINSQLSTIELKKKNNKNKLIKQLEQEQNHRYGDHFKVQELRSIIGGYKIDRGMLRTV